jgi:hypothetical protein
VAKRGVGSTHEPEGARLLDTKALGVAFVSSMAAAAGAGAVTAPAALAHSALYCSANRRYSYRQGCQTNKHNFILSNQGANLSSTTSLACIEAFNTTYNEHDGAFCGYTPGGRHLTSHPWPNHSNVYPYGEQAEVWNGWNNAFDHLWGWNDWES